LKVKIFFAKFDRCCSNLWFNKQYKRCLLGQPDRGLVQWRLHNGCHVSPVATENTCTRCFQRSHPKKGWGKNGAFMPTSTLMASWEGKREWGWTLGTYIYTMEMGDDASTMVQLRKNNILLNYLSFLSRKITTMPYLPVWWASFNEWTEWYTSLHNSFWWGVSEIHSPSYSYTARRMLVVYSLKHDDMPRCDGL